jgi:Tfp pilus assembly PilM family ATPase
MVSMTKAGRPVSSKARARSTLGIEFDTYAVRGVRMTHGAASGYQIDSLCEERGDFTQDANLLDALRKVKSRLNIGAREPVCTLLSGKQVWAGEVQFRPLAEDELLSALKLEVRKNLHFEASGASIDYQLLSEPQEGQELANFMVVAAHNNLIQRQVALLERTGLRVSVVEVLPAVVGNALWAQVGNKKTEAAHVALHFGPQVCTVCIDGEKSPFFNRSIYFAAEEVYGKADQLTDRERDRRLHILGEEITRTLAYYEKNSLVGGFGTLVLFGDFAAEPGLPELAHKSTGIKPVVCDLTGRFGYHAPVDSAKFALALALSLREDA